VDLDNDKVTQTLVNMLNTLMQNIKYKEWKIYEIK
jgi:hypothetical protein